jgi:phosphoglycerate dehydrogenase-like enzyme
MIGDFDVIIAGTEQITTKVMNVASKLKMISRVGIGLDSVDLLDAKEQGITVSYTPDAPAPAELTIGLAHPVTISAIIINTARGGIINEHDLYKIMQAGHLSGAAIDVFDFEPYDGKLREIQRCILTAHMGSMSVDCRTRMEIEATEEAVRFLTNQPLKSVVPEEEYAVQREGL